ncbi:MAG TPA: hypothetical protein VK027_05990 [Chitinophagaceae bacterium]|nr:hypothetical protein [Chitinophagaceae bacterium]
MKNTLKYFLFLNVLVIFSCTKSPESVYYTKEEFERIIEEETEVMLQEIEKEMEKNLEIRRAIELRSILDSMNNQEKETKFSPVFRENEIENPFNLIDTLEEN